jgi:hypothetical protein
MDEMLGTGISGIVCRRGLIWLSGTHRRKLSSPGNRSQPTWIVANGLYDAGSLGKDFQSTAAGTRNKIVFSLIGMRSRPGAD